MDKELIFFNYDFTIWTGIAPVSTLYKNVTTAQACLRICSTCFDIAVTFVRIKRNIRFEPLTKRESGRVFATRPTTCSNSFSYLNML